MAEHPDPIAELVAEHTAEAEATRDDPYPEGTTFSRRGTRNAPVSVRLSDGERHALEEAAQARGVGVSTLARELITHGLATGDVPAVPVELLRKVVAEAVAPLKEEITRLTGAA
ncbi:CopG domain protein DNA-binding domain protein [Xylanimonas cellulosilytica DSM 15894]|uniref:CopG domain protein DNA-binding domain protein n=1 Tax=Xylanimonas cellulosilytica (strain DSM 15894 / JCM 12276 / CECT 5975 / KCTC 9989 / LMG 20990 / NBRC 107835 / XIL07) TaxID=446471 RepID=D1BXZ7_XYLCX|nr:CopG domain-containing protein DNA-binding domain-containing protein [Xylanimonas cellulosilytica]ACZ31788.1 CopG domain protein DNA-binding domain protein [Xylanimonas cellulosilytica DSM 15894]